MHWDDINFEEHTISVNRSRKYLRGIGYADKDTKSKSSLRTISLPASVFATLAALKVEQNAKKVNLKENWIDDPHVFKQWNGKPMSDDAPYQWFMKFVEKIRAKQMKAAKIAGRAFENISIFPVIRFHDLRHANATLMISEGVDIQVLKKRLGHAQASTTLNMYGHALDERDKKATEKLENLLTKRSLIPK